MKNEDDQINLISFSLARLQAHNLFKKLGLGIKLDVLNYMVTLKDILVLADQKCPSDPNSEDNVDIFCRMVSRLRNGQAAPVQAKHIGGTKEGEILYEFP